jgi:hypothetical protein
MRVFLIFFAVVVCGVVVLAVLSPSSYVGVCADTKTHVRVPDKKCEPKTSDGDDWVYYNSNDDIPAVGQQAEDNIAEAPDKDDDVKRGGVPEEGQQGESNSGDNVGNSGGDFEPAGGGSGSEVGVNSGDEGGENAGSSGGGEDGE